MSAESKHKITFNRELSFPAHKNIPVRPCTFPKVHRLTGIFLNKSSIIYFSIFLMELKSVPKFIFFSLHKCPQSIIMQSLFFVLILFEKIRINDVKHHQHWKLRRNHIPMVQVLQRRQKQYLITKFFQQLPVLCSHHHSPRLPLMCFS